MLLEKCVIDTTVELYPKFQNMSLKDLVCNVGIVIKNKIIKNIPNVYHNKIDSVFTNVQDYILSITCIYLLIPKHGYCNNFWNIH